MPEGHYVITVEFRVRPGHEADFFERVRAQAENSLTREPNCLQFDVCTAPDNAGRIFLYEIYSDEAAFQQHLETAHFKDFDAATADWTEYKGVQAWHRADGPGPKFGGPR